MAKKTEDLSAFTQYLVSEKLLSLDKAKRYEKKAIKRKTGVINVLEESGSLNPSVIANHVAHFFKHPLLDLEALTETCVPTEYLAQSFVKSHDILPLYKQDDLLFLAISDPTTPLLMNIKAQTGMNTSLIIVEHTKLEMLIDSLLSQYGGPNIVLENIEIDDPDLDVQASDTGDGSAVIRYLNNVLLQAVKNDASDIHFEPFEDIFRIRSREDGILKVLATPSVAMKNNLTSRLKIMANLDIAESRVPQDGRATLKVSDDYEVEFRVSTCPTSWGEKVVMRVMSPPTDLFEPRKLGMSKAESDLFGRIIEQSQGMVLVTGPAGSGKSVTLYTGLNMLNDTVRNIMTVEDPVEINVEGINQVPVNNKAGLNFGAALRSFLRQDPDVIMLGEIRDLETAEISFKAAQTGHMVFSTLHTNTAPETLTRLSYMGVSHFNIASTVSLIISQRLVRKLCDDCKTVEEIPKQALLDLGFSEEELPTLKPYGPVGCAKCKEGYKGRRALFSILTISDTVSRLIMDGGNAIQIEDQAKKEGYLSLNDAGRVAITDGETSVAEVNRVTVA